MLPVLQFIILSEVTNKCYDDDNDNSQPGYLYELIVITIIEEIENKVVCFIELWSTRQF